VVVGRKERKEQGDAEEVDALEDRDDPVAGDPERPCSDEEPRGRPDPVTRDEPYSGDPFEKRQKGAGDPVGELQGGCEIGAARRLRRSDTPACTASRRGTQGLSRPRGRRKGSSGRGARAASSRHAIATATTAAMVRRVAGLRAKANEYGGRSSVNQVSCARSGMVGMGRC